jgi:O-antigen ligase
MVQFADVIGAELGVGWLDWLQPDDRHSGWWKPAVGGSLLVGALGLHLPAAFMGRGGARWLATACAAVTVLGLLATGTRGAWIAAAALIAGTGTLAAIRAARSARGASPDGARPPGRPRMSPAKRAAVAGAALVALAGLGSLAWWTIGPSVVRRIELTRQEWRQAWEGGDYSSFTGQRVLMAQLAIEAFLQNPVGGVGMGGYPEWTTRRRLESPRPESAEARERRFPHAHNALLHAGATAGTPGLALTLLIIVAALRGAFAREQLGPAGLGSYAAGPGFAMIGLLLVSAFDTLQVNAPTVALTLTLMMMSMLPPPRTPGWVASEGAGT